MRRLDETVYRTVFLSMPNRLYGFDSISRFADLCKALLSCLRPDVLKRRMSQIRNYIRCNFSSRFLNFLDFLLQL